MNNLGMNPMGMNPMQMNNMGMMGMNNQPNLMDQTALNVKSIIEPYENKIRELEEIIKQKDFEITVLKQKLNNNVSKNNLMTINPNLMMNMNPMMNMNMNNPWMNPSFNNNRERIYVLLKSNINSTIECFKDDKTSILEKYLILTYNYEPLYDKTLEECGISNNSIINVTDKIYNVTFSATSGLKKTLTLSGDCPIKKAIKLYFRRLNRENIYEELLNNQKHLFFIYGSIILSIRDERPLNIILSYPNPVITVNDTDNIIGGKSKE